MNEFESSPDFVARVMAAVRAENQNLESGTWRLSVLPGPVRWSVVIGGALITIGNLARILLPFFIPVLCR